MFRLEGPLDRSGWGLFYNLLRNVLCTWCQRSVEFFFFLFLFHPGKMTFSSAAYPRPSYLTSLKCVTTALTNEIYIDLILVVTWSTYKRGNASDRGHLPTSQYTARGGGMEKTMTVLSIGQKSVSFSVSVALA